jgi:hypothetical protein
MIFPLLYLSYAIAINYMPIAHLAITSVGAQPILIHGGVSVYGYFTCINPNVHANIFDSDNKPD